eukprot:5337189-Amphidinium_carterae.1
MLSGCSVSIQPKRFSSAGKAAPYKPMSDSKPADDSSPDLTTTPTRMHQGTQVSMMSASTRAAYSQAGVIVT